MHDNTSLAGSRLAVGVKHRQDPRCDFTDQRLLSTSIMALAAAERLPASAPHAWHNPCTPCFWQGRGWVPLAAAGRWRRHDTHPPRLCIPGARSLRLGRRRHRPGDIIFPFVPLALSSDTLLTPCASPPTCDTAAKALHDPGAQRAGPDVHFVWAFGRVAGRRVPTQTAATVTGHPPTRSSSSPSRMSMTMVPGAEHTQDQARPSV
jgi:hypothetical protein